MEFSMRDFETAIAMNGNGAVNVQQKKFDLADVDNSEMKLENDDWNIDSIFPLNNDFLNDLGDINMDANWADAYDYMSSPTSTGTGTESENDHDMLGMKPMANQMLSPPQNLISSSSSDSGLSSDHHVDFDLNFDQLSKDLLQQPLLSNQIIPELVEPEPAQSPVSIQKVKPTIMMTQQNIVSNTIQKQNVPEVKPKPTNAAFVQIKNSDSSQKPRVQIIKKIPSNIVQIADSNGKVKLNQAVISENIISNNPIVINKFNGNISGIRKVIQLKKSPNQKPIILPFTLKNGTDIRSIKIIKPSSLTKSPKILMAASNLLQEYKQNEMRQNTIILNKPVKVEPKYEIDSMSEPSDCESYKFEDMIVHDDDDDGEDVDDYNNDSDQGVETDQQSEYPKLVLSGEEKRLLAKEGIKLPAHYPLTKQEERELKRIRRKIRNKISAQDSRKRKKEYVDGLEERVKKCTDENQTLIKRIKLLQTQNQNLINQMKKMQSLLTKGGNKSVQPATCLMVLLMSMALIAAPNLKMNNKDNNTDEALARELELMDNNDIQQNRRALLFDSKEKFSDMGDMVADEEMSNDFTMIDDKSENEHNYAETKPTKLSSNKMDQLILDYDVDDTVWEPKTNTSRDQITPKVEPQLENGDSFGADHIIKYDFSDSTEPTVTHSKRPQNLSDLPVNDEFRLKLTKIETNFIDLKTEIDAKNV